MSRPTVTAIPVCGDRIAFHFAWCTHVIIVEMVGNTVLNRYKRAIFHAEAWDVAHSLVIMNIDQLVCEAIPSYFRDWFESKNIRIIDRQEDKTQHLFELFRKQILENGHADSEWKLQESKNDYA